ncbi:MAG: ABC transporter ATP-binding protein [Campylobacterota bacterium]
MIEVNSLYKSYKNAKETTEVLHNINLSIKSGQATILQGVSGSGKSTLLSLIAGFEKPSSGSIEVAGEPISKLPDLHQSRLRNEHIGFVFQSFNLFEDISVFDNVMVPTIVSSAPKTQRIMRIEKALQLANIAHKKNEIAKNLSGGEKQRCAIARALVNDPQIILCDEPTANLDAHNTQTFIQTLQMLHSSGKTVVVATHDPIFDQLDFIDQVIHIADGKVQA